MNSAYLNWSKYKISGETVNFDILDQVCPKKVFLVENRKREHHHWILRIWIGLSTKFQAKLSILIFWTKFAQKRYFWSKAEKVNIIIEFCVFELVYVPNFRLNYQFWFFGSNLPKTGASRWKQKKWTAPLNSAYLN